MKISTPSEHEVEFFSSRPDSNGTTRQSTVNSQPCTSCYKQDFPIFDTTKTRTYKNVECETDTCTSGGSTFCNDKKMCQYRVEYANNAFSQGDLATETLTLGRTASFRNFTFGCGSNNGGAFALTASGIFDLGNGKIPIVNQEPSAIGGRFSYCLIGLNSNVTSTISFGSATVVTGPRVVSTPIVTKGQDTFYFLTLQGLSAEGQRIDYKPSPCVDQQSGSEGNIILDTGTTLTYLPSNLYEEFEAVLKSAIRATPVAEPSRSMNLCYSSESKDFAPTITAHFKGADVVLSDQTFMKVSEGLFYLTLVSSPDLAIFGNFLQKDLLIGYDIPKKQVSFLRTDCTKSR